MSIPWGLLAYAGAVALQRTAELIVSARNARALAARGGVEFGRRHFAMFVVLHGLYPAALAWEVLELGAQAPDEWPAWLAVWLAAQALRLWAIASLGAFWNVRVWVLPGAAPIARGAYRWMRHPNYIAVAIEFVAAPIMFGAWRTALAFSLLNAIAMAVRIPEEERALALAATPRDPPAPPAPRPESA